jgi:hypothetical protein
VDEQARRLVDDDQVVVNEEKVDQNADRDPAQ